MSNFQIYHPVLVKFSWTWEYLRYRTLGITTLESTALCLRHKHDFVMMQTGSLLLKTLFLSNMFPFFQPISCLTHLKQGMKLVVCISWPQALDLNLCFPGLGPNLCTPVPAPFPACVSLSRPALSCLFIFWYSFLDFAIFELLFKEVFETAIFLFSFT